MGHHWTSTTGDIVQRAYSVTQCPTILLETLKKQKCDLVSQSLADQRGLEDKKYKYTDPGQ